MNTDYMHQRFQILKLLSDGKFHSGEQLAKKLGISRAAIWKHIQTLQDYQLDVHAVTGKGYRLSPGIELFDAEKILESCPESEIQDLQIFTETTSTNEIILDQISHGSIHRHVVLAEYQESGRGRRGRYWLSRLGSGICLSVGWRFEGSPETLMGLSLATGVGLIRALEKTGIQNAGLKWPNDVLVDGRKLAGILLEMRGESAGPCNVVLGVGINVQRMPARQEGIEQPRTDVETLLGHKISRNELASGVIKELLIMLQRYQEHGFTAFLPEWNTHDCLLGQQAVLLRAGEEITGTVHGVDQQGALLMDINGQTERVISGDVSLRKA